MKIFCVYTKQHPQSVKLAKRCFESGKKFSYDVQLYPGIYWKDLDEVHRTLRLKQKYKPSTITTHTPKEIPAARMANGTTHYCLYVWSIENNLPVCILEHDAIFVGKLPKPISNGVIQISSHTPHQLTKKTLNGCRRAQKMRKFQPEFEYKWDANKGVIRHPLTGTNGTSGYIIHPGAAAKMVEYIRDDGIANADRIRTEWVGEGNIYLQVPQSIICDHAVRSIYIKS